MTTMRHSHESWLLLLRVACLALLSLAVVPSQVRAEATFAEAARLELARDYEGALAAYEAFLQAHPRDDLATVAAAAIANIHAIAREDRESAIRAYTRVVSEYPLSGWGAEASRRKAECLQALERWNDAGSAYAEALALAGREREPHSETWVQQVSLAMVDCFQRGGEPQRVIEAYEHALAGELAPLAKAGTLIRLGEAYEVAGKEAEAAARYLEVLETYPLTDPFEQALAKEPLIARHQQVDWEIYRAFEGIAAARREGDFAAVERGCDEVLARSQNPRHRERAEFGKLSARAILTGQYAENVPALRQLVENHPDLRAMPNLEQTLAFFTQAANLAEQARVAPQDAGPLRTLGALLMQQNLMPQAAVSLERAAALAPDDAATRFTLGQAYAASGRLPEAAAQFHAYLEQNPQDAMACNQIGYTYLAMNQAEASIPFFRRYVEIAPDDANAHDSLGEGLMRGGHLSEAVAEYETAIRLDVSFANSYFMLGEIHRQLGNREQARAAYARFVELAPDDQRVAEARTHLSELG
jgi:tetratricopeptide (TPR) repeat protein